MNDHLPVIDDQQPIDSKDEFGPVRKKVGILGVSGYGGGETLRLCAAHPNFEVVYVAGDNSVGQKLNERFPRIRTLGDLAIKKFDPAELPELDVLFASLPTGQSKELLASIPSGIKVIDIGGDHRFVPGWTYGLADVWPEEINKDVNRVANPGCYAAATLVALAPLVAKGLIELHDIIIDAKSGVSGAGRGGGETYGFADVNEDVSAYGLFKHAQIAEITKALTKIGNGQANVTFTPHLIPMTRGILSTCYAHANGRVSTSDCLAAAREFYTGRTFVGVVESPPHTKWATGSNLAVVSYAAEHGKIIAMGAIDNLGKGAAGQAVQNANLITGLDAIMGITGTPLWP